MSFLLSNAPEDNPDQVTTHEPGGPQAVVPTGPRTPEGKAISARNTASAEFRLENRRETLLRYVTHYRRDLYRAMGHLQRMQQLRKPKLQVKGTYY
jgi:hypothetical protein